MHELLQNKMSIQSEKFNFNCLCCGSKEWKKNTYLPRIIFGRSAEIVSCRVCGCGATVPAPNLKTDYYKSNQDYPALFKQKEILYLRFAKNLLYMLDDVVDVKGKKLLDVGCGGGFVLEAATTMGVMVKGIEANEALVNFLQQKNLNVMNENIDSLISQNEKYDIIVLSAILEHLADPGELIKSCSSLLSDDGIILISQASYDGLLPRVFPWGWYGWQPMEHYWHFTPASFHKFTESHGFKVVKLKRGSLYHQWFYKGGAKNIIGRNLATLLAKIGGAVNMGDSFNVILKKC